jgi:hypothetical protein
VLRNEAAGAVELASPIDRRSLRGVILVGAIREGENPLLLMEQAVA